MAPRKRRIRIVLDTNVWVAFFLGGAPGTATAEIVRLWRDIHSVQLIVGEGVVAEYLEVMGRMHMADSVIEGFAESLQTRRTVSHVSLGPRIVASPIPMMTCSFPQRLPDAPHF